VFLSPLFSLVSRTDLVFDLLSAQQQHKTIDIKLDMNAPIIIIPEE